MIDVSVIVPVYNVEDYLSQCLDSLINQSLESIEIICINDGSTDGSQDILNEYADRDNRIKVISQSNQGLGAARNNGIKMACGNYIYFLDSDDFIDKTALEKLLANAVSNDSDIVLFKFQNFGNDNNVHRRGVEFRIDDIFGDIDYDDFTFTYRDARRHVMNSAFSACLKLYKKEFLDSFDDFQFPQGLSFEDVPFHVKAMTRASKISFVNEFLYNYRSNPSSILNSTANGFDIFEVIDFVEEFLRQNDYYDDLENEFIFFKIAQILVYMISTKSEAYFKKAKAEFSNITIKDTSKLKKYAIDGYELVLSSDTYTDYIIAHYENKITQLNARNRQLSSENKRLEKANREVYSSNSWKVTKPLRALKNYKK